MNEKPAYEELEQRIKMLEEEAVERKQSEDALRESEEWFRALTESTSDWIWEIDQNGIYSYASPKVKDLIGYEPKEVIGKTPFDLMPADEAERVGRLFRDIVDTRESFQALENTNLHKDGRHVVLETSGVPIFNRDGNLTGYRGIDRDITYRKQTERELQKKSYDLRERVKELNCLHGISELVEKPGIKLEEIIQGIVELLPSAWQYPEITCSRIIFEREEYKTENHKETEWKQSKDIYVFGEQMGTIDVYYLEEKQEIDEGPFLKEERKLINSISERLGRIIERKRTEDALQKAHDELELRVKERTAELVTTNEKLHKEIKEHKQVEEELKKSSESIKLFAYSVLHDLKSPVFSLYGLTKLLNKRYGDILDDKGKNYCDQILKASERIAKLAEQINVYISTKEAPLNIEPVKIKQILQAVRDEFSTLINLRQIKWIEPGSIPEIDVDRLSITRVIRNLVDNAFKYGGDDLSVITIGYEESLEFHILSVSDDGVGVNVEDSNKIFELFKRHETSRGIEGAGLGLAIVKEIVERHGGKVWVEPWPEKGSIFNISISKRL